MLNLKTLYLFTCKCIDLAIVRLSLFRPAHASRVTGALSAAGAFPQLSEGMFNVGDTGD